MTWVSSSEEEARDLATRVVGGILKTAKIFVPTFEDGDNGNKKVHRDTPILDGTMYVGSDRSLYMASVELRLHDMCKKDKKKVKDPVRAAMLAAGGSLSTKVNYGRASPWLKTHGKSVRFAEVSPEGIVLAVARGMIELRLVLDADERAYAERVRDTIASRILDEKLLAGPFPLPEPPGTDTAALVITDEGATFTERLTPGADAVQLRLKTKSIIPGESATCWAYDDPLGERIVRIRTEAPAFTSEQYWRVLEV